MPLSVVECHYAECRILNIVVTNVIKLSSVMLNVVVVSVVAPKKERSLFVLKVVYYHIQSKVF